MGGDRGHVLVVEDDPGGSYIAEAAASIEAVAFLEKPVDPAALFAVLRRYRPEAQPSAP
jgi:hypothetical protein